MALLDEFWTPNKFGVRGGVESAFMSTTLNAAVAMGYAAGDGSRMGIVIEVQQGMANRGAEYGDVTPTCDHCIPCMWCLLYFGGP
jgi:glycine cleavage system aminomethyltransferase T